MKFAAKQLIETLVKEVVKEGLSDKLDPVAKDHVRTLVNDIYKEKDSLKEIQSLCAQLGAVLAKSGVSLQEASESLNDVFYNKAERDYFSGLVQAGWLRKKASAFKFESTKKP
jgi:hypothetical protein